MNYELNPTSESMKISQAVQQACSVGMKVFCWWVCKEELHLVKVHTGQKRCVIDLGSLPFLSGQDSPPREVTLWTSVFLFHWSLVGTQKIIFHILPDGMSSKPEIQGQWYSDGASAKGVEGGDNWENWNSHTRFVFPLRAGPGLKPAIAKTTTAVLQSRCSSTSLHDPRGPNLTSQRPEAQSQT